MNAMKLIIGVFIAVVGARAQAPPMTTDKQIEIYQKWVAADPSNVSNQIVLAGAFIQKTRETTDFGYLDKATRLLDGVLATGGRRDPEALRLKNTAEMMRHHFKEAAEGARTLTAAWSGDIRSWGTLADALLEMGHYDEAKQAIDKMMELKPGLMSYNRLGFYEFLNGRVDEGIGLMRKAVEAAAKYPENKAWCLVELGNQYFKSGRRAEAERAYREALESFPGAHMAHAGLASVHAAEGRTAEAVEEYKRAQAITPMVQYSAALFDLYTMAGNKAEADRQWKAIEVVVKLEAAANQKANRTLALIFANQDRNLQESLELARADYELRRDVYTSDALAWALFKNGRLEEALKMSREALRLGTPEAVFSYHLGMIANAMGDAGTARKALDRALGLNGGGFDIRQAAVARGALAGLAQGAN